MIMRRGWVRLGLVILVVGSPIAQAEAAAGNVTLAQHSMRVTVPRKRATVKRAPSRPAPGRRSLATTDVDWGVSADAGYEARYGNGMSVHAVYKDILDVNGGMGYNLSGFKVGAGADLLMKINAAFGLMGGGALVFSTGRTGEVSLDAKFHDETGGDSTVVGTKKYTVSGAEYINLAVGAYYDMNPRLRLSAMIGYNLVVGGNKVSFEDADVQYDREVDVTNAASASEAFRKKAEEKAKTGGPGAMVGVLYMI